MADAGGQEKTEDATPKKMREARKKGQASKSKDMTTVMILIAVFGTMAITLPFMINQLGTFVANSLMIPANVSLVMLPGPGL